MSPKKRRRRPAGSGIPTSWLREAGVLEICLTGCCLPPSSSRSSTFSGPDRGSRGAPARTRSEHGGAGDVAGRMDDDDLPPVA